MRQKSRGGIIDLDAEENNVISIDSEDEVSPSNNQHDFQWRNCFDFRQAKAAKHRHLSMQPIP